MSLAVSTNIAARKNRISVLTEMLKSLSGQLTYHVSDGQLSGNAIADSEIEEIARTIAMCSLIYVLEGTRGRFEPIAGFIANESLGHAQLLHYIDSRASSGHSGLSRQSAQILGAHVRAMFSEYRWLNAVAVPGELDSLQGLFGLTVASGQPSIIRLAEAAHRPLSSRD